MSNGNSADSPAPLEPGNYFEHVALDLDHIPRLRAVQRDVLRELGVRFQAEGPGVSKHLAVVCTGAGKSGIIALSPFVRGTPQMPCHRTIVVAPNQSIRDGLAQALGEDEYQESFYQMVGAIPHGTRMPKTMMMTNSTTPEEMVDYDIVVCTAQLLGNVRAGDRISAIQRWEEENDSRLFGFVVIDEAHHIPANTWQTIVEGLRPRPAQATLRSIYHVLLLTATPFRSDGQRIVESDEEMLSQKFTLLHSSALEQPVTKELVLVMPPPLPGPNGPTEAIARMMCELLVAKRRESGNTVAHKALGRTRTKDQARDVANLINGLNLPAHTSSHPGAFVRPMRAATIFGGMEQDRESVMTAFRSEQLSSLECVDIVIQCGCLGEGYDQINISVAGIFTGFGSLAPFAQFIGRIVRRIPVRNLREGCDAHLRNTQESPVPRTRRVACIEGQNIGHVVTCTSVTSRQESPLTLWREFETQRATRLEYEDVLDDFVEHESDAESIGENHDQEEHNDEGESTEITRLVMAPSDEKKERIKQWDNFFDYMRRPSPSNVTPDLS